MNIQRIRELLLNGTLGMTGGSVIIDFDEDSDSARALFEQLFQIVDEPTE
jgi:hypothetical protein